jgi:hypothetical protein
MPPADPSYDIVFSGELTPGADPHAVRERLRALFKLPDETLDRLFSGRPVAIKRGVDAATAKRYRDVFRDAGAVVQTLTAEQDETGSSRAEHATSDAPREAADGGLQLAPMDGKPLETPPEIPPLDIDISHLQLVPGMNWSLEDCAPPIPPIHFPDISHLHLVAIEPVEQPESQVD